ncbi:hypothetical protein HDU93_002116 [Gonapodya sp. JEL0774]|nr:hypothetical protein HDU93_002116 [Gonapodya sp. JEL0774]
MCDAEVSIGAVQSAKDAWSNGDGKWVTIGAKGSNLAEFPFALSLNTNVKSRHRYHGWIVDRIAALREFVNGLTPLREIVTQILQWEICKTKKDAESEFDRTIGPFNYPLNETYAQFIPALIIGNSVVLHLPREGVACHFPMLPLFRDCFPPGVVSLVTGSGRETMQAMIKTGDIDCLAFVETHSAAKCIIASHPRVNRFRTFLELEGKCTEMVLENAVIEKTVEQVVKGALSFNGQRCTALKGIMVNEVRINLVGRAQLSEINFFRELLPLKSILDDFLTKLSKAVDDLPIGLPLEDGIKMTPLTEVQKPDFLRALLDDDLKWFQGSKQSRGIFDRSLVSLTVLTPVNWKNARLTKEEQFGLYWIHVPV